MYSIVPQNEKVLSLFCDDDGGGGGGLRNHNVNVDAEELE
jgi:hypothetical protein